MSRGNYLEPCVSFWMSLDTPWGFSASCHTHTPFSNNKYTAGFGTQLNDECAYPIELLPYCLRVHTSQRAVHIFKTATAALTHMCEEYVNTPCAVSALTSMSTTSTWCISLPAKVVAREIFECSDGWIDRWMWRCMKWWASYWIQEVVAHVLLLLDMLHFYLRFVWQYILDTMIHD